MLDSIGASCITIAVLFDLSSYYRQVQKTLKTGKSSQVSSTALLYRTLKYVFALVALAIYDNWVAFGMQSAAFIACTVTLIVVAKKKPKGWKLWN